MPSEESYDLTDVAVYWPATGLVGDDGQPTVGAPVEIMVRWVHRQSQGLDSKGSPRRFDASITVNDPVTTGSLIWLGTLEEWYGVGSAGDDTELMHVVAVTEVPDTKGRFFRRTAKLAYFKDAPGR